MKITAHMGVMDEADLVVPAIEHLYRIGTDHVIVFDMGSTDGTLEAVEQLAGPRLDLVRLTNDTPWDKLARLTVESVKRVPADWVLFLDADEFWLPATGSLRDCAALSGHDCVTVDRHNVVATPSGPLMPLPPVPEAYSSIYLYTRKIPNFRQHMEQNPDTPWISGVPVPKVISRTAFIQSVTMGAHDIATADGQAARRARARDLVVAHLPVSTSRRFHRRITNISDFLRLNPGYLEGSQGWHWKRFHEIAQRGGTDEEFQRQLVDQQQFESLAKSGAVQSAAELLGNPLQAGSQG
jgi:glycosyltransferase involved in cell wall biosynthesis